MLFEGIDRRSLTKAQQEQLRRLAIERITSGKSKPSVAKELGVCLQAVHNWWNKYQDGIQSGSSCCGKPDFPKTLLISRGRKPKFAILSIEQQAEIKHILVNYLPRDPSDSNQGFIDNQHEIGLAKDWAGRLIRSTHFKERSTIKLTWSIQTVKTMIHLRYGIELSNGMVNRLLKKWGFIPDDLRKYPIRFRKDGQVHQQRNLWQNKIYKYKYVPYFITLFSNPESDVSSIIALTGKHHINFVGFTKSALNQPTLYYRKKVRESLVRSLRKGLLFEKKVISCELSSEVREFMKQYRDSKFVQNVNKS